MSKEVWIRLRYPNRETLLLAFRAELQRVAQLEGVEEGYAPTRTFYNKHGRFAVHAVPCHVLNKPIGHGSWIKAVEKLGFKSTQKFTQRTLGPDSIRIALDKVRAECKLPFGVAPSIRQYRRVSKELGLDVSTYLVLSRARTGSWIEAMQFYGQIPRSLAA